MRFKLKILLILSILLVAYTPLFAYWRSDATSLQIQLRSSARANLNEAKRASPLPVSIFLLRASRDFKKYGYFSLEENAKRTLGSDLLYKTRYTLLPKGSKQLTLPSTAGVKYVGIIAGYNSLKNKSWRRVIPYEVFQKNHVAFNFNSKGLKTSLTPKVIPAAHSFYVDGTFALGFLAVESNTFKYNHYNQATLLVNRQQKIGPLGIGFGYQWQRTADNWLNTLHLEKVSVGLALAYSPSVEISGNDKAHLQRPEPQELNDYSLKATELQYLLETKINFLRTDEYTPYVSFGYGTVTYNNNYTRTKRHGNAKVVKTSNNNSASIYKIGIGCDYDMSKQLTLSLGYQYTSSSTIDIKEASGTAAEPLISSPKLTISSHDFLMGVRYYF